MVFYSMYGHVYRLAQAVSAGAREVAGTEVPVFRCISWCPATYWRRAASRRRARPSPMCRLQRPRSLRMPMRSFSVRRCASATCARGCATSLTRRADYAERYRFTGGATDQRTHLSTALWPCVPYSRSQLSLIRCMGSPRSHPVKRTSDNIKSHILIWVEGGQSGVTCQAHNSPSFAGTRR